MSPFPPHYGITFTPTTHASIPPSLHPRSTTLPHPFIAVITGAGKGLGYHIALAYARAGCSGLSISSRTMADLDALEREIRREERERDGRAVEVMKSVCDTQDVASVEKLAEEVRGRWGRVDVVVANAGVISRYVDRAKGSAEGKEEKEEEAEKGEESNLPIGIIEDADWNRVMDINLLGTWRVSRAFMPLLEESKGGAQTVSSPDPKHSSIRSSSRSQDTEIRMAAGETV